MRRNGKCLEQIHHGSDFELHRPRLLDNFFCILAHQRATSEADCRKAKPMVRLGPSNSAGSHLCSASNRAFAATDEFVRDITCRLGAGDGRPHLRIRIIRDASGTLDSGRQLEQRCDFQAGARINPARALSVRSAPHLYWHFDNVSRHSH